MSRGLVTALKLAASLPIGLIIGELACRIIEGGLWPLLFLPASALEIVHWIILLLCQAIAVAAAVWFWALDRSSVRNV